ncbi:PAS domain S-box protein [Marichromatium bheemlicum]|uniref:histidine kinase n=1 Tax=Marichromatium bheemlicum TaxID=365339 RepID=A0ABX1I8K5_9GAMM|nr:PAS domain S-box protein [Marichromatium bheemlicum]NKN32535.1 PAS domain S-box protein [Marichromatium bheemlicum]
MSGKGLRVSQLTGLVAAGLAALIGVGFAAWATGQQVLGRYLVESRQATALSSALLSRMLDEVDRDLHYLARGHGLSGCATDPETTATALLRDWPAFMAAKPQYDQLRWIDVRGRERVRLEQSTPGPSMTPPAALQDKSGRPYFTETMALAPGETYVSALDLNVEHGGVEHPYKPVLRLATPVVDDAGRGCGILIVNYLATNLVDSLAGLRESKTWLLNRDGYWLVGARAEDAWGFMRGRPDLTLARRHPAAWARIASAPRGQFEDEAGLWSFETLEPMRVLAAPNQVDGVSPGLWKLVDHVPRARYRAELVEVGARYLVILAGLGGVILVAGWALRRSQRRADALREAALRFEAQRTLLSFIDQGLAGMMVMDPGGRLVQVNTRLCEILGRDAEDLTGRHWSTLAASEDPVADGRMFEAIFQQGRPCMMEKRCRRRDGGILWVNVAAAPVRDVAGAVTNVVALVLDISEQKEVKERLRLAVDAAEAGVWTWDVTSGALFFSDRCKAQFGLSADVEMRYQHFLDAVHPADRERVDALVQRAVRTGEDYVTEYRVLWPDGSEHWINARGRLDAAGQGQLSGITLDVTRRKRIEARLRALTTRLEGLLEALPVGVGFTHRRDCQHISSNAALRRLFGLGADDNLSASAEAPDTFGARIEYRRAGQLLAPEALPLQRALREERAIPAEELEITLPDARQWVAEVTAVPLFDEAQQLIGGLVVVSDISARKQAEVALQALNLDLEQRVEARTAEARAASAAKSAFVANMSHEVRTPMNAVLGFLEILLDTELAPDQRDLVTKIQRSAQSLLGLLNDILDFSKLDADKIELESSPFVLDQLLRERAELFAIAAAEKGVELLIDAPRALTGGYRGDALRLGQILNNLLGNAIKFTAQGCVILAVQGGPVHAGRRSLRIEVRDTGIGISAEQVSRLFQPFSQADVSTTRRFGGTGLGLTISERLVALMGGKLGVESREGEGSTFWFTLALEVDADVAEAPPAPPKPERVLVVDVHDEAQAILGRYLGDWGFAVECVTDAASALQAILQAELGRESFSLLLADWRMLRDDGLRLLTHLDEVAGRETRPATVVMVSAYEHQALLRALATAAVQPDQVLKKPLTQSSLFDAVVDLQQHGRVHLPQAEEANEAGPYAGAEAIRGAEVLLVEDNHTNQEVALAMLGKMGLRVSVADNGHEALVRFAEHPFELVLMDLQMPGMDGFEATAALRETARGRDVPIIAMTAAAFASDRDRVREAGMNDHIAKPVDPRELVSVLRRWLPARSVLGEEVVVASRRRQADLAAEGDELDLAAALERLDGDEALLRGVLEGFMRDIADWPSELAAARAAGDMSSAQRLAHTLKGAAGSVGAVRVQQAALALEQALAEAADSATLDALQGRCLAALESGVDALRTSVLMQTAATDPDAQAAAGAFDLAGAQAALAELEGMLQGHRLVPAEQLHRLRSLLAGHPAAAALDPLVAQLDDFAFAQALATLQRIREGLTR